MSTNMSGNIANAIFKKKIKELQKSFNNLNTFRPKCGKLFENGVFDERTQTAFKAFVTACKQNKLMEFFKSDPYNTVLIIDHINSTSPLLGIGGTTVYRAWRYSTKAVQRIIWGMGAKYYLIPRNCDTAAYMLKNSLKKSPSGIAFEDDSEIVDKLKGLSKFRQEIEQQWQNKTDYGRNQAPFSGTVELQLNSSDDLDLYYSFGKIDIAYNAVYDQTEGWIFDCYAKDTYDFGLDEDIPYQDIFDKGVKQMIRDNKGRLANNAGWFSENEQVITAYDVTISFKYSFEES